MTQIDALPSSPPLSQPSTSRREALQHLYLTTYSTLAATAYDAYPDLNVFDNEKIMQYLGECLHTYKGSLKVDGYQRWAQRVVTEETKRYQVMYTILDDLNRVIHAAINRFMGGLPDDRSVEHQDVYWEIAHLIFTKADGLAEEGTAKLSTRITALVKQHVKHYYASYRNRRHRLNRERVEAGLPYWVETIPPEELASMRADDTAHADMGA